MPLPEYLYVSLYGGNHLQSLLCVYGFSLYMPGKLYRPGVVYYVVIRVTKGSTCPVRLLIPHTFPVYDHTSIYNTQYQITTYVIEHVSILY